MTSAPVLAFPNSEDHFILDTDASEFTIESNTTGGGENHFIGQQIPSSSHGELLYDLKRICWQSRCSCSIIVIICWGVTSPSERITLVWYGLCAPGILEVSWQDGCRCCLNTFLIFNIEVAPNTQMLTDCHGFQCRKNVIATLQDDHWNLYHVRDVIFCTRLHEQWRRFEEEVDDVVPLSVRTLKFSSMILHSTCRKIQSHSSIFLVTRLSCVIRTISSQKIFFTAVVQSPDRFACKNSGKDVLYRSLTFRIFN